MVGFCDHSTTTRPGSLSNAWPTARTATAIRRWPSDSSTPTSTATTNADSAICYWSGCLTWLYRSPRRSRRKCGSLNGSTRCAPTPTYSPSWRPTSGTSRNGCTPPGPPARCTSCTQAVVWSTSTPRPGSRCAWWSPDRQVVRSSPPTSQPVMASTPSSPTTWVVRRQRSASSRTRPPGQPRPSRWPAPTDSTRAVACRSPSR